MAFSYLSPEVVSLLLSSLDRGSGLSFSLLGTGG